jgi:hypothetical protein
MPFTVTGGKYALQTLTAAGTNTVTVNAAVPFVVADFPSIQRIACLYAPAGPDLIVNGDFATNTDWVLSAGVTISGGAANVTAAANLIAQNVSLVIGQLYTVTVQYTRTAGANLRFCNSMTNATNIVATLATVNTATLTTLRFSFIAVSNGFKIEADGAVFTGTIDNVTLGIGASLKGIAYVRRATSTTVLELETPFYDHATGIVATQAVGDRLLISKNWAECATTGWSISNNVSSITDFATVGVLGDETGACIYDESRVMQSAIGNTTTPPIILLGGVWVQGHLQDYATGQMYGACDWSHTSTSSFSEGGVQARDLSAHYIVYGGKRSVVNAVIIWEPMNQANTICRAKTLIWKKVDAQAGILGPGGGNAPWFPGTESRMQFIDCSSEVLTGFNICWRPNNAVVSGGSAKIVGNGALAVFGSGYNGFAIAAPSGQRFIVSDVRSGALWDQFFITSATANFTNVLTPITTVARPSGSATVTFNWYFKGAYQNLGIGSLIQILKADGTTTETSVTTTTTNTDLTVLARTHSGAGTANPPVTYNNANWTYAIWRYGFVPLSGSFAQSSYSLGTAGNSLNVVHGAFFNQVLDLNITQTNSATVAAYTVLSDLGRVYDYSMYDKGLNITNMKWLGIANQTFTISGVSLVYANNIVIDSAAASVYLPNTSTNVLTIKAPTLATSSKFTTLQAAAIQVNASTTVSANLVGAVTNAGTLSGAITGAVINTGTINGARITGNVTQATPINLTGVTITGNLTFNTNTPVTVTFTNSSVSGTVSNSGTGLVTVQLATSTIGTVGTNVTTQIVTELNLTGLLADSQIYLSDGTNTQVDYVSSSGTSYTYNSTGGTGTWTWRLRKYGYQDQTGTFTPATNSATVAALYLVDSFVSDTLVNVTAYTDLETTQKIYDYSRYFATTNTGIALGPQFTKGFGTLTANSAFTLDPLAVAMMAVSSGVITHTTGLNETATVVVTGNFTQGTATLSNNIKIRATNLDSELLFSGIDSLTIYATQADALTNTSPGASSSTGIIRFLYGASLSGVTMSGTVYLRIVLGTAIQVQALTLVLGENEVNLSTTTLLQAIPSEVLNATVEANVSLAESLRLANSVLGGKVSGAGTATETFRDINDTKNRVVADVDNNGNRTAITLDLS